MIPKDHPRYHSLIRREKIAEGAREGIVAMEGVSAHGRGEAFDYLLGEKTTDSAELAERVSAAYLKTARHPVISVNGNTAALASAEIAALQKASGAFVEVNLFHRTEVRMRKISALLNKNGVDLLTGKTERLLPLSHDRALCLKDGIFKSDVVLVPLEDGDRCRALREMGKTVITIDLNPLSRTARTADVTIVDELTRALPNITRFCGEIGEISEITNAECDEQIRSYDNKSILRSALDEMKMRLNGALD